MILTRALITERTISDAAKNSYTFVVSKLATKTDVKRSVESTFGVKVIKINTISRPGKSYRSGKKWIKRERPDGKKAIVTLKAGDKIDLFETTKVQE